jgi:hypothetical protein
MDVAIPADKNIAQKVAKKKLKYKSYVQRYNECGT